MKVGTPTPVIRSFQKVAEKSEKGEGSQNFQDHLDRQKHDEPSAEEVSDEQVQKALDAFTHDEQAHEKGIQAESTGHGPGLRVTLKDKTGVVIRQLSGEEFLKLREAVNSISGKLLDKKY